MRSGLLAACVAVLAMPSVAGAETLPVSGIFGAQADLPAAIDTIVVERFDGEGGTALALEIGDQLASAEVEGEAWFRVIPLVGRPGDEIVLVEPVATGEPGQLFFAPREQDPDSEAVLFGSADILVDDVHSSFKTVSSCRRRVDNKCVEQRVIEYECRLMTVRVEPEVWLVAADGRQIYARRDAKSNSRRYCTDDATLPTVEEVVRPALSAFARDVRMDLAPIQRAEDVRLMEQRKGLARAEVERFKQALRLTKNDPVGACLEFEELDRARPDHGSVLFNLGLCRESEGNYDDAQQLYDRAISAGANKSYPRAGQQRIFSRMRGWDQIEARREQQGRNGMDATVPPSTQ